MLSTHRVIGLVDGFEFDKFLFKTLACVCVNIMEKFHMSVPGINFYLT